MVRRFCFEEIRIRIVIHTVLSHIYLRIILTITSSGFLYIYLHTFIPNSFPLPALHAERIANFLNAKEDPTWPETELQDRILEEDLSLQMQMLKDYGKEC